jgi:hypothetical protein
VVCIGQYINLKEEKKKKKQCAFTATLRKGVRKGDKKAIKFLSGLIMFAYLMAMLTLLTLCVRRVVCGNIYDENRRYNNNDDIKNTHI